MDQFQSIQLVTYDPIRRLPYDVWTECIKFAMADDSAGPLPYLGVSPEWSRSLMEEPSLWTTIIINREVDQAARLHVFLYLSHNSLLDVIFSLGGSIDMLRATLEVNPHRIRSIKLEVATPETDEVILDTNYSLPTLQAFGRGFRVIPTSFLRRCPNLRTISANIEIGDHHLLNSKIQDVVFTGVTPENIHELSPNSKYRSLGIWASTDRMTKFMDHIELNKWSRGLEYLSLNLGPRLESLSMSISSTLLTALIRNVPLLRQLHTLDLSIHLVYQVERHEAILGERLQQVHSLSLSVSTSEDKAQDAKALSMMLKLLNVTRFLQHFEEIYIYSPVEKYHESQLGSCLRSAMNARKITVNVYVMDSVNGLVINKRRPPNEVPKKRISNSCLMARLESLTVNCPSILDYISARNSISLKLKRDYGSYSLPRRKFAFQVATYEDDGMLERLHPVNQENLLRNCHTIAFWQGIDLRSSITFDELADVDILSYGGARQRGVNGFLSTILQDPDICPSLHTIRMWRYPFWELLFALMRQRLAGSVNPIKKLVLPGLPCAYLLSHITRLLKGDTVFTASNVDGIIYQRHSDEAINACMLCISAGYMHCDGSGIDTGRYTPANQSSQGLDFLPDNPDGPYPTPEEWIERGTFLYGSNTRRKAACRRHSDEHKRIEITEHASVPLFGHAHS